MTKGVKPFLSNDFLLESGTAVHLYEQYAAAMPILDFHNHLSPKDIAENRRFEDITSCWLDGDHYKWRAMRANGVAEMYCTGSASPFEKFQAWAATVPWVMRNPLYHWTHLELKNYFGITQLLNESTAREIFDACNELLHQESYRVRGLLSKMNVEVVCTTDDPADTLEYHRMFGAERTDLKMYPSFRPDRAYDTGDPQTYNRYLDKLAGVCNTSIRNFDHLISALSDRISFFGQMGCRASDHGLDHFFYDADALSNAPVLFQKLRDGKALAPDERLRFRCAVLLHLCRAYHAAGWVQQFHVGALRNNNARMLSSVGPDTGFDSMGDFIQAPHMSKFLDSLNSTGQLTRTIVYNLNPAQNEVFATMTGNFCDGSVPGKVQLGSGWWFLDQKDGMEKQMNALSNMGLLSRFVGMVTDSRSILSFPRHEYFRRTLCNLIGGDVERGELPADLPRLGQTVRDICYYNAKSFFGF